MKTAQLRDLNVSRVGLGAMTMAGTYTTEGGLDDSESIRTIHRALELGVTRGQDSRVRVHRGLVQPPPPALHPRLPLPSRVRTPPRRARRDAHLTRRSRHRRQRLSPFRDRPRCSNGSRSGRDERCSRDEQDSLASPTGSPGADSLIQTSTTQGKTCRPNRGRSIHNSLGGCRKRAKAATRTLLGPDTRASTKAGVGPVAVSDVLFATCTTGRLVGNPGVMSGRSADLLCRDCGSRRCACCQPQARQPASAPGSRSRGRAATLVNADLAPGPDETRVRADAERRLLQPRDDAEARRAEDLPSFGRGNGDTLNRRPELRGT